MAKWFATTIALVVDEVSMTNSDHHLAIKRNGESVSITWAKGFSHLENTINVEPYRVRSEQTGTLCAILALELADLVRQETYPAIPCALTVAEQDLCHARQYIQAIKAVRARWNDLGCPMGLRDAKDLVDAYRRTVPSLAAEMAG